MTRTRGQLLEESHIRLPHHPLPPQQQQVHLATMPLQDQEEQLVVVVVVATAVLSLGQI
jgi:hypothetical protein